MIIITDGDDTSGLVTEATAVTAAQNKALYAVPVGSSANLTALQNIAGAGNVFPATDFSQLNTMFDHITLQWQEYSDTYVDGMYFLYYATPKRANYHTIDISIVGNSNAGADSHLIGGFNADGFSDVVPEVVITGENDVRTDEPVQLSVFTRWSNDPTNFSWNWNDPLDLLNLQLSADSESAIVSAAGMTLGSASVTITDNNWATDATHNLYVKTSRVPANVQAITGDGTVSLTWDTVTDAAEYKVYWSTISGVTKASNQLVYSGGQSIIHSINNGPTYYYAISSVINGVESELSTVVSATPIISTPMNVSVVMSSDGTSNTISWDSVAGATSYTVYWNTTGSVTTADTAIVIADSLQTYYSHTGLDVSNRYYYSVVANDAGSQSNLSTELSLPAIAQLNVTNGAGRVTLDWPDVEGASSYQLFISDVPNAISNGSMVNNVNSPYIHNPLTRFTGQYYVLVAVNSVGESYSTELTGESKVPVSIVRGEGQLFFNWDHFLDASQYNLYYSPNPNVVTSPENLLLSTSGTTFVHDELSNTDTYYYLLTAIVNNAEVEISAEYEVLVGDRSTIPVVAINRDYGCALDLGGLLECWAGDVSNPNPFTNPSNNVPILSNPTQVGMGYGSICALDDTGLVCWGDGTVAGGEPVLSNPSQLSVAYNMACAIDDTGVVCWGDNRWDLLNVPDLINPTYVSVAGVFACALDDTGVVCWGDQTALAEKPELLNPIQISAHTETICALDDTGVVCWGNNSLIVADLINPSQISLGYGGAVCALDETGVVCWGAKAAPDLTNPSQISVGFFGTVCALTDTGVVCWGGPTAGNEISDVPSLTSYEQLESSGTSFICALDESLVNCWGDNTYGLQYVPDLTNPGQISVGSTYACALDDIGVVCWGDNTYGQTEVPDLTNPTQVSSGFNFSCALDDIGVVCWGGNSHAQTEVPDLTNPTQVSSGYDFSCALDDTGVVCWGNNTSGQTEAPDLTNPTQVSPGSTHACALDDTGVVCWGSNIYAQTEVPNLSNPTRILAGGNSTCSFDDAGLVCWGLNYDYVLHDSVFFEDVTYLSINHYYASDICYVKAGSAYCRIEPIPIQKLLMRHWLF